MAYADKNVYYPITWNNGELSSQEEQDEAFFVTIVQYIPINWPLAMQ